MRLVPRSAIKAAMALACLGLVWQSENALAAKGPKVDAAIVFLADMSDSMDENERHIIRESHARAVTSPPVLEAIEDGVHGQVAFAYVEFGNQPVIRIDWWLVDGTETADIFAAAILHSPMRNLGLTGIADALVTARFLLARCPCQPIKKVVDVAADGENNIPPSVFLARKALLAAGATINGLPIDIDPDGVDIIAYFADNIIGGPTAFNLPVTGMDQLQEKIRRKIVLELY